MEEALEDYKANRNCEPTMESGDEHEDDNGDGNENGNRDGLGGGNGDGNPNVNVGGVVPVARNYMPPKRDLKLIDEHFESVSVDVISNIAPSNVKTVESKHKIVDVNHKGVFSTEEPKLVMKNNFSTPIIEIGILMMKVSGEARLKIKELMEICTKLSDRVLDLENIKSTQAKEIADLKKRVKKIGKKEKVQNSMDEFIQDCDFDVQAMMDVDYEPAARLRAEEQRRKPLTKA
uniref:Uncharacterized protein n=1 Tax=Tanacetum cinerariifolium TaxID=118510 RepID=A0A6L2LBL6_TANCI|nr:hypothetical protein [Tanacetum cinerariifolium]